MMVVKYLAQSLLKRGAEIVLLLVGALLVYWAFLEGSVLGGPIRLSAVNEPWTIGKIGTNRYVVRLLNKKKNCPLKVQHVYIQDDKTTVVMMPSENRRTGIFKTAGFPARPPLHLKPGIVQFYVVVHYQCNPLFPQTYTSNEVTVRLKCEEGSRYRRTVRSCA